MGPTVDELDTSGMDRPAIAWEARRRPLVAFPALGWAIGYVKRVSWRPL